MPRQKIAIIDSDPQSISFYREALTSEYDIDTFDAQDDIPTDTWKYELTIVDILCSNGNLLEKSTEYFYNLGRKLVISENDNLECMRRAKKLGALDYLLKPVTKNELLFKVEQLCDHANYSNVLAKIHGLTPKEEKILTILNDSPDFIVEKDDLVNLVWKTTQVTANTIEVHLSNLRKKIKPFSLTVKNSGAKIELLKVD